MQVEHLSKSQMVEICRRLGIKTGDTARNPRSYYAESLATHSEPEEVERAVEMFATGAPAVSMIGALPKQAAHPEGITVVGRKTIGELFGLRGNAGKMSVEVWNDPGAESPDPDYKFNRDHLARAVAGLNAGQNIWLYGPAGTGKTEFVRNLAAHLGRSFFRVSFDAAMERYEYLGGERVRAGTTVWQDGIILQAMTRPGAIVLLDEVGFARPEYTSPLHPILEPRGKVTITETGRIVEKAHGVCFMAADNSNGCGDMTGAYVGVRQQNRAFTSRFGVFVKMDYLPEDEERSVIETRSGCNADVAMMIVSFLTVCRASAETAVIESAPSLREAFALAQLLQAGLDVRGAFEVAMFNRVTEDNAEQLQQLYKANVDAKAWGAAVDGRLADHCRAAGAALAESQATAEAEAHAFA